MPGTAAFGESCPHSSKSDFSIPAGGATSQISMFPPPHTAYIYASAWFPHASLVRMSQGIALPWNSVLFQTASIFTPRCFLVQVPDRVPFVQSREKTCGTLKGGGPFLFKDAQVWSRLDDWLIWDISSLSRRRDLIRELLLRAGV